MEDTYWWFRARRQMVRSLLGRHGVAPGALVLDAGCGTGGTFAALRDRWRVVGVDLSPAALRFCRQRGMDLAVVGDLVAPPLKGETFDAVVTCDVLEHIGDDRAAIRALFDVTRPGGVFVGTVPALQRLWSEHDEVLGHYRRYERGQLRSALEGAGWRIELLNYTVSLLLPSILLYRSLRRLRPARDAKMTDLVEMPPVINSLLWAVSASDAWLAERLPMPPGASFVAVARKPFE